MCAYMYYIIIIKEEDMASIEVSKIWEVLEGHREGWKLYKYYIYMWHIYVIYISTYTTYICHSLKN